MKANDLLELVMKFPLIRGKAKKLKIQLKQQIVSFLGPHYTNLMVIKLA